MKLGALWFQVYTVSLSLQAAEFELKMYSAAPASLRPCILNCSGSYSFTDGMTASCTVDSDPTGEGITSIVYNANNRGFRLGMIFLTIIECVELALFYSETANGIPTFGIGTEYFHNGLNQVEIVVSHVVCGRASLNLQFHLREPTGGKL